MPISAFGPVSRILLLTMVGLVLIFLTAPILILASVSFSPTPYIEFPPSGFSLRWYQSYLTTHEWQQSTWISFQVATLSALLATVLGVIAAYGLRRSRSRLAAFIQPMLVAPMIIPVITLAVGMFYFFAQLGLVNTLTGLTIAHAVTGIPIVIVTVGARLQQVDLTLENAAQSLGASRTRLFFTITLPIVKDSIFTAALLAFVHSLDEVVIALFLTAGDTTTLPRRFFSSLRDYVDPTIAAVSMILIVISAVCLTTAEGLRARTRKNTVTSV